MKPFASPTNQSSSVNTSSRSRSPSPKSPAVASTTDYSVSKSSVGKGLYNLNLNRNWPASDPFAPRASISHSSDTTSMSIDSVPSSLRDASVSSGATTASTTGPHSPDGSVLRSRRLPSIAQLDLPPRLTHDLGRRYSLQPSHSQHPFSNGPRPSFSHPSSGPWPLVRDGSPHDSDIPRSSYVHSPLPRKDIPGDDLYRLAARASRARDASMGSPNLRSNTELGLHEGRSSKFSVEHTKRKAPESAIGPSWAAGEDDRYRRPSQSSKRRLSPSSSYADGDGRRSSLARSSSVEARSRRSDSQGETDSRVLWGQQLHAVPGFQEGWSHSGIIGASNSRPPASGDTGSPRSGARVQGFEPSELPPPFFPGVNSNGGNQGSTRPSYLHRHSIASDPSLERREPHQALQSHAPGRASYYAARPSGSLSMGSSTSYGGHAGDSDDGMLYNGDDGHFLPDAAAVPARKRGKLPKETTELLRNWLLQHAHHPYPSEDEKRDLCRATQLSMSQICNWVGLCSGHVESETFR